MHHLGSMFVIILCVAVTFVVAYHEGFSDSNSGRLSRFERSRVRFFTGGTADFVVCVTTLVMFVFIYKGGFN